ncbi:DUF4253 domain-containing protein [Neobacillus drentensis]|uniref:DUF4253 domain-containing protein n=1 Tax=Neobacillus drentensis TaxID=220684 RepID=UPI001F17A13B|nr:DUF4253 domain-containing protein [Neobacillus drentensis]ULT56656.1 DUF4253 domain-containing protein [Neobacillus drentensis]
MGIFDKFKKKESKDYINEIMARLDCDSSIVEEKTVKGVMTRYHQAFIEGKKEGYTPLVIIPSEMMLEVVDTESNKEYLNDKRESIIAKAKNIDVKELLKNLLNEVIPMEEDEHDDITGEFAVEEQINHFLSIEEAVNKKIILAKIPTDKPWEVAAWVPMGGFNECPMPEEQVAVFKYWYERYGATPALVTPDVWEFFVSNPPKTQEESELLAWEQFGFCGDIVWQGAGTVNALAGTLMNSSFWYFWWD